MPTSAKEQASRAFSPKVSSQSVRKQSASRRPMSPDKSFLSTVQGQDDSFLNSAVVQQMYLEPPRGLTVDTSFISLPQPLTVNLSTLEEKLKNDFRYVSDQKDNELQMRLQLENQKTTLIEKYQSMEIKLRAELQENKSDFQRQLEETQRNFELELDNRDKAWAHKLDQKDLLMMEISHKAAMVAEEAKRQIGDKEEEFKLRTIVKDQEMQQLRVSHDR